jgi:hypothetical protein
MDITKIIQNTALFRGVSLGVIEELKGCCQERKLSKGSDLFSMGDPATSLFVVVKGVDKIIPRFHQWPRIDYPCLWARGVVRRSRCFSARNTSIQFVQEPWKTPS